jgi:hypothetical protein
MFPKNTIPTAMILIQNILIWPYEIDGFFKKKGSPPVTKIALA